MFLKAWVKRKQQKYYAGDICAVVGMEDFNIGDTIADPENPEALPVISVDEPTMSMHVQHQQLAFLW